MKENLLEIPAAMVIQYSVVGVILLAACLWILWKIIKKQKNRSDSCCGCSLADNCSKKQIVDSAKKQSVCSSISNNTNHNKKIPYHGNTPDLQR